MFCSRKCVDEHKKSKTWVFRKCKVCGKNFKVRKNYKKELCSDECRIIWGKILENKESRITNSIEAIQEKYNTTNVFKLKSIKEKSKKTKKEKYGNENYCNHKRATLTKQELYIEKLIPKLKNENIILLQNYIGLQNSNRKFLSYMFKCTVCKNEFEATFSNLKPPVCRKCFPIQGNSKYQREISEILSNENIEFKENENKLIYPYELDFYIENKNLAIEINGNYYHSEIGGNKDKTYHINKTKMCYEKGIKLIHIFEDEILYQRDIVISRLLNEIGLTKNKIHTRKCEIKTIDSKLKHSFLEKNHLQGNAQSNISLGLFYENELVSIITFLKLRKSLGNPDGNKDFWELTRFCNKINHNIPGAFQKLMKHFIKINSPEKIITFSDNRWSNFNYEKNVFFKYGFNFSSHIVPSYYYLNRNNYLNRKHRFNYRKEVLRKELEMSIEDSKNITEWEMAKLLHLDRIWDCGKIKFELNLHKH